ncbi:AAA family ATPase [Candidatus Omnitrophota bacterium]
MKTNVKALVVAASGDGKTHFAGTFPKSTWIITEPSGFETVENRPDLLKNVVKHEEFLPSPIEPIENTFKRMETAITEAHKAAAENLVETLVLDNLTYLAENRWIFINKHQALRSSQTGELDTRGMYGILGRWLYQFIYINFTSFPGNVVVSTHVKQESEEAMKKKVGNEDIVPSILGGFRNDAPGLFSIVMYLDKIPKGNNQYDYYARVNKGKGKQAKNRYGLPEVIKDISYKTIYDAIVKAKQETKGEKVL